MDKLTLTKIIDAFNVASKDETRFNLTFVRVKAIGSAGISILATDGTMLSEFIADDAELHQNIMATGSDTLLVPRDALPILKAIAKEPFIPSSTVNGAVQIGIPKGIVYELRTEKEIQVNYPDAQPIIDMALSGASETEISFNPELLRSIFLALKAEKSTKGLRLKLNKDPRGALLVTVGTQTGIMMPMRL